MYVIAWLEIELANYDIAVQYLNLIEREFLPWKKCDICLNKCFVLECLLSFSALPDKQTLSLIRDLLDHSLSSVLQLLISRSFTSPRLYLQVQISLFLSLALSLYTHTHTHTHTHFNEYDGEAQVLELWGTFCLPFVAITPISAANLSGCNY